jgi:hypothetical protein
MDAICVVADEYPNPSAESIEAATLAYQDQVARELEWGTTP